MKGPGFKTRPKASFGAIVTTTTKQSCKLFARKWPSTGRTRSAQQNQPVLHPDTQTTTGSRRWPVQPTTQTSSVSLRMHHVTLWDIRTPPASTIILFRKLPQIQRSSAHEASLELWLEVRETPNEAGHLPVGRTCPRSRRIISRGSHSAKSRSRSGRRSARSRTRTRRLRTARIGPMKLRVIPMGSRPASARSIKLEICEAPAENHKIASGKGFRRPVCQDKLADAKTSACSPHTSMDKTQVYAR